MTKSITSIVNECGQWSFKRINKSSTIFKEYKTSKYMKPNKVKLSKKIKSPLKKNKLFILKQKISNDKIYSTSQ